MSNVIQSLIQTAGWKEIEVMFLQEISKSLSPEDIDPKLSDSEFSREVRARIIASAHLKSFLNKIKLAGVQVEPKDKPTFK